MSGAGRSLVACAMVLFATHATSGGEAADASTARAPLAAAIEQVLSREALRGSSVGVAIARLSDGEILYENGADRLLPAASTTKLASCAGAWLTMGKDHRLTTRVVSSGKIRDDVLEGDLVFVAAGDPNLSQRLGRDGRLRFRDKDHSYAGFFGAELVEGDPLLVLRNLARAVKAHPVRRISGDVVLDDGIFQVTSDSFVGSFSAACVNDQLIDVLIEPGSNAGDPVKYRVQPEAEFIEVTSAARTVEEDGRTALWLEPLDGLARFELRGTMARDASPTVRVAKPADPGAVAAHLFAACLQREGISWDGTVRRARRGPEAYGDARTLAEHTSAPLSEALRVVLKTSQNVHATMLPPLIGAELDGRGTPAAGFARIRRALARAGLETSAITLGSGSGGARADWLTSRWLVDLLRVLATRDDFPVFLDALPVGGIDGTLADHFVSSRLVGRVHAKTGTLRYRDELSGGWIYVTKALAGYLDLGAGPIVPPERRLVFAIIMAGARFDDRREGAKELFRAQEDILRAVLESEG